MTELVQDRSSRVRLFTRIGFWASSVIGLLLPWAIILAVDKTVRHIPFAQAWRSFTLHLFAPGYNLFLIGLLTAVPFVILSVVILLHLGTASIQAPEIANRRTLGLACAWLGMLTLAGWTHIAVLLHPDAQGALAYVFLPITLLLLLPIGYAVGRLAAKLLLSTRSP
ncbi:MAG: hypothetical protein OJF47_001837 [Nitrospira sp.]|jgi:hypothetical protein|nr:MAG: hypothetical protein OJF47_001837 [Nitrospira sp.]